MPRLIDNEYIEFFKKKGVPGNVLFGNAATEYESVLTTINFTQGSKAIEIGRETQSKCIKKMFNLDKPYLAILSGKNHDTIPAQVALIVCVKAVEVNARKTFRWHTVTSGFNDKLLTDEVTESEVNESGLLVLSNIAVNSTPGKLEKVRDILEKYSYIPRIVVMAGANPYEFAYTQLYVKPNLVAYFGKFGQDG